MTINSKLATLLSRERERAMLITNAILLRQNETSCHKKMNGCNVIINSL